MGRKSTFTDDEVRAILLTPAEVTTEDLARALGRSHTTVRMHRIRRTRQALRVARKIGLIAPVPTFTAHPAPEDERRAYVVDGGRP